MKFSKQQWYWILYDPACSAHAMIVRTLFAGLFFKICADGFIPDSNITAWWSFTASTACLFAGVISISTGAVADAGSRKRTGLTIATVICIASCFAYTLCDHGDHQAALGISFAGIAAFAVASSFYDALLPDVALPAERGDVSTAGFAFGYLGAIITALICMIPVFTLPELTAMKTAFAIAGFWFALLAMPLLCKVKEREKEKCRKPKNLRDTCKFIAGEKNILLFLIAYLLYIDCVGTIMFAAAPLAAELQISPQWVLTTILGLQFLGLPFTLLYGKLAKKFSTRSMIYAAISTYMLVGVLAGAISFAGSITVRQGLFVAIAILVGTAQGGIQALSRALYSRMIPAERAAELFSIYNIFGRFTTIIGPLLMLPLATWLWGKAELGITLMIIPLATGMVFLSKVKVPRG